LNHHGEVSGIRQISEETQQKLQNEITTYRNELSDLKSRCDVLLHIISDRDAMRQSPPVMQMKPKRAPESEHTILSGGNYQATLAVLGDDQQNVGKTELVEEADAPVGASPLSETPPAATHESESETNGPIPELEPVAENPTVTPRIPGPHIRSLILGLITVQLEEALQEVEKAYDEGTRSGVSELKVFAQKPVRTMLLTK